MQQTNSNQSTQNRHDGQSLNQGASALKTELPSTQVANDRVQQQPATQHATNVPHPSKSMTQVPNNNSQQETAKQHTLNVKSLGPVREWSDENLSSFLSIVNNGITGEELMKFFEFKRRKELEAVFYELSARLNRFIKINWQTDYNNGEHALPDLKSAKEGLRISNARFARYGFEMKPNTFFDFKRISDTEIKLTIIG